MAGNVCDVALICVIDVTSLCDRREEMYRYARATVIPSFSAVLRERNEDAEEFKARTTTTTSGASGSS